MDNQNNAKKIIEVDLSNKWPVGSVIVAKSGTGRHRSSALIVSYLGNDTVAVNHASGRPSTMNLKTLKTKYQISTEAEASIFRDAAIGPDKDSAMGESKDAVPRGPRKVESAPAVEPPAPPASEPAPQPTPAPDASMVKTDASVIELIFKQTAEDRERDRRWFAEQMERQDAKFMSALEKIVSAQNATQPVPPPVMPTKEQVKRGENAKVIKAELPWARPLVSEFIADELEMVTFNTAAEIERAMFPGEVHEALELWCEMHGKSTPDSRTTYAILGDIDQDRHLIKKGSEEKYKTRFARRRQTAFDFEPSANDVDRVANDVLAHGRNVLWPDLPAGDQSAIRVAGLLKDGKVTKAELIAAINGARIERDRLQTTAQQRQITPLTVFADAARVRYLGKTFRDLGGGK